MQNQKRVLCSENEDLVSYMLQKRQELVESPKGLSENLEMTLSKAYSSVCCSTTPIKTLKDLSQIKYVCCFGLQLWCFCWLKDCVFWGKWLAFWVLGHVGGHLISFEKGARVIFFNVFRCWNLKKDGEFSLCRYVGKKSHAFSVFCFMREMVKKNGVEMGMVDAKALKWMQTRTLEEFYEIEC
jgi:hypothetical protein